MDHAQVALVKKLRKFKKKISWKNYIYLDPELPVMRINGVMLTLLLYQKNFKAKACLTDLQPYI